MENLGSQIAELARKGALDAARKYYAMSVDGTVWNRGIEQFITTKIVEKVHRNTQMPVELEYPYGKILDRLGAANPNRKTHLKLKRTSKFDAVVFRRKNKKPIALIEVKKRFANFKIETDRERILDALLHCNEENSCVRFGIIVTVEPIRATQMKKPEDKINEIENELNNHHEDFRFYTDYNEIIQDFGVTKKGVEIVGARAYSIVIRHTKLSNT